MTQQYAKFISEDYVKFAPRTLKEPNFVAFNFDKASDEVLRSKGYYPLVYIEEPTTEEGFYSVPHYQLVSATEEKQVEVEVEDAQNAVVDVSYIAVTYTKEPIEDESNE